LSPVRVRSLAHKKKRLKISASFFIINF